jgi:secretion/DNA translocation related TadE-like protein
MTTRDRGSASVWLLAVGLVLLGAGLAAASTGAAHVAHHRAQAAADLGALAGAVRTVDGGQTACDRARAVVAANQAQMVACRVDGLDLAVTAQVATAGIGGLGGVATATARAGPLRADDSLRQRAAAWGS